MQFTCDGAAGRGRRRARRVAALGPARAARHHLGQGRLRAPGSVRLLHGAGRRRAARRVRHPGRRVSPAARSPRSTASTPPSATGSPRAFVATGGSQCGFCTPGILVRVAAAEARGKTRRVDLDRALAAHLCRCTGWQTRLRRDRAAMPADPDASAFARRRGAARRAGRRRAAARRRRRAARRRRASPTTARRATRWSRCRGRPGSTRRRVDGRGHRLGRRRVAARGARARGQGAGPAHDGRPRAAARRCPAPSPAACALATSWVEPAYLEPDASWCAPGGEPATPLANGGAFGGKVGVAGRARRRASSPTSTGRTVRVVFSREDVVRLGPKRPPIAATAACDDGTRARCAASSPAMPRPFVAPIAWPYDLDRGRRVVERARRRATDVVRRARGRARRARGARSKARCTPPASIASRSSRDARARAVLLDTCVARRERRARRRARRCATTTGRIARVDVRVAAGDPLDAIVLRSYAIGAAHMALGWVLTEGLAVDPDDRRGPRPHHPVVRHHPRQGHAADRRRDRRRSRCRRSPARPTRCSPRWRRRRGTR